MKILITGTHFTPAQALITELQKSGKHQISYIGRETTREGDSTPSVESQVLPKLGVKFHPIDAGRLQRSFGLYTIPSLIRIPVGFIQSLYLLINKKPKVVVSFGGYVGVPVVLAAWLLSIPVILHEQTLVSSLANKISSWFADNVAISYKENQGFPENKIILTGNPMRAELLEEPKQPTLEVKKFIESSKLPLVYITGGNQGAHTINLAVNESLAELTKICCLVHQTGDSKFNDYEELENTAKNLEHPERYLLKKWFDVGDLSLIFRRIDLAVTRAGINSLQELVYFQIPIVVIPIENHYEQQKNARFFNDLNLAVVLPQSKLSGKSLVNIVKDQLGKKRQAANTQDLVIPDAAKRLSLEVELYES